MKTVGIIPVGFPESAAPAPFSARLARRRLVSGKPLIEWVLRRASEAQQLEQVAALLPDTELGTRTGELVPPDVVIHTAGEEHSLLEGLCGAAERLEAGAVVCLHLDAPFTDPELIDRLITSAASDNHCDYASFCSSCGDSAMAARLGLVAQWFRRSALRQAVQLASGAHVCPAQLICSHPERFKLRLVPLPVALDRRDLRLRVHDEEDWDHAHVVAEALGEERLEWQQIARLVASQPSLRRRMKELNSQHPTHRR